MMDDCYGCKVTTTDQGEIDVINEFSTGLVRLGKEAECILGAVDCFFDCPLIFIYGAYFQLFAQTAEGFRIAGDYLQKAQSIIERCTDREKSLLKIGQNWHARQYVKTLSLLEEHCNQWPNDLVAIKTCEYHYYCNGQKYESKRFLDLTQRCYEENKHLAHFLSMHAFANELCGNYDQAEKIADESINIDSENPWAHHCLSHLYINRGECEKGIKVLEEFSPVWKRSNRMIESHNMWHLALLYLEQRDLDKVIDTYHRAKWENDAVTIGEEVDVAALLWRLDMEGYDVDKLWANLGNAIVEAPPFATIPFVSVQLCYALKRSQKNEALNDSLETIQNFVECQKNHDRYIWEEVGLPLIYGSLLYADGEYEDTVNILEPIIEKVGCVGGSDAQIDLFYQTYFKALTATQRTVQAANFLKKMIGDRPLTPLEQSWQEA